MESFLRNLCLVDGQWLAGENPNSLLVLNKSSNEPMAEVNFLNEKQLDQAMESSLRAFENYKSWSAQKRSDCLLKLHDLLEKKAEAFASLICEEAGKPISYARAEVARCLYTLKLSSEEARRIGGEVIPVDVGAGIGKEAYTKKFPLGVISCISPFNFPLNLALHKIGPALACGNCVILKPSPYTPLTALTFGSLIKEAGFPDGVVNIVVCEDDLAQNLVTDYRIKMLSFTGSPQVGWMLKDIAGKKKVALELGGNASVYVDSSVSNISEVASSIVTGAFLYSGQICISTQRVYVESSIYDELLEQLTLKTEEILCGDPKDETVIVGPLIDEVHVERIHRWLNEAVMDGATIVHGGYIMDEERNIYAPTILTDTTVDMKVVKEEIFGPVVVVERVDSFEDGIDFINDSKFGLQAGIFTNRIDQMKYAFNHLDVAGVMINNIPGFRIDSMPYGGVKDSGFGREGIKYAIDEMTEEKLIIY